MVSTLFRTPFFLLFGLATMPLEGAVDIAYESADRGAVSQSGQELLMVTNDLWFLLSGVTDKDDADAAAPRFEELISRAAQIGDSMFAGSEDGQDVEALGNMPYQRIAEAYEDLYQEFDALCQTCCYGSEQLLAAFRHAVELGVFGADTLPDLDTPRPPLSKTEANSELVRFKRLIEPDRALLEILQKVKDAGSAAVAAAELENMNKRLEGLRPEESLANRSFADTEKKSLLAAYVPIEPLLWGIRNEIVRIASIPGYDTAPFDAFSDALDEVFEKLSDTHSAWFDEVFDASFRADLDEALRENLNATTSN